MTMSPDQVVPDHSNWVLVISVPAGSGAAKLGHEFSSADPRPTRHFCAEGRVGTGADDLATAAAGYPLAGRPQVRGIWDTMKLYQETLHCTCRSARVY